MQLPELRFSEQQGELGYAVAIVLDVLTAWALEQGQTEEEVRDRFEEAIERAIEEAAE